uniref:PIPK domain-containing protein n=1 Tax=Lotharella globosa TaxID=91324 RepID=A0A6V3NRN2_9EUKA
MPSKEPPNIRRIMSEPVSAPPPPPKKKANNNDDNKNNSNDNNKNYNSPKSNAVAASPSRDGTQPPPTPPLKRPSSAPIPRRSLTPPRRIPRTTPDAPTPLMMRSSVGRGNIGVVSSPLERTEPQISREAVHGNMSGDTSREEKGEAKTSVVSQSEPMRPRPPFPKNIRSKQSPFMHKPSPVARREATEDGGKSNHKKNSPRNGRETPPPLPPDSPDTPRTPNIKKPPESEMESWGSNDSKVFMPSEPSILVGLGSISEHNNNNDIKSADEIALMKAIAKEHKIPNATMLRRHISQMKKRRGARRVPILNNPWEKQVPLRKTPPPVPLPPAPPRRPKVPLVIAARGEAKGGRRLAGAQVKGVVGVLGRRVNTEAKGGGGDRSRLKLKRIEIGHNQQDSMMDTGVASPRTPPEDNRELQWVQTCTPSASVAPSWRNASQTALPTGRGNADTTVIDEEEGEGMLSVQSLPPIAITSAGEEEEVDRGGEQGGGGNDDRSDASPPPAFTPPSLPPEIRKFRSSFNASPKPPPKPPCRDRSRLPTPIGATKTRTVAYTNNNPPPKPPRPTADKGTVNVALTPPPPPERKRVGIAPQLPTEADEGAILRSDLDQCIRVGISASHRTRDEAFKLAHAPEEETDQYGFKETLFLNTGKTHYSFRIYSQKDFACIRARFGVSDKVFEQFVGYDSPDFSGGPSKGKSKRFVYFSGGKKFVMKTMSEEEALTVRKCLPSYLKHIQNNPNTLLSRTYGLYRLQLNVAHKPGEKKSLSMSQSKIQPKIYLCIMNNVFDSPLDIHYKSTLSIFTTSSDPAVDWHWRSSDAEGSKRHRDIVPASTEEESEERSPRERGLSLSKCRGAKKIYLGDRRRALLLQQLKYDSDWLAENNIIDYSLLCGMSFMDDQTCGDGDDDKQSNEGGYQTSPGCLPITTSPTPPRPPPRCSSIPGKRAMQPPAPPQRPSSPENEKRLKALASAHEWRDGKDGVPKVDCAEESIMGTRGIFQADKGGILSQGGARQVTYFFGVINISEVQQKYTYVAFLCSLYVRAYEAS